jgi:LEA14-like dessication related protein
MSVRRVEIRAAKAAFLVAAACATAPAPVATVIPVKAEALEVRVVDQTLTSYKAVATVKIANPTGQAIKVTDADYELVMDEKTVDEGTITLNKEIPAKGEVTVEVEAKASYAKDGDEVKDLSQKQSLDFALRGNIGITGPGIPPDTFREFAKAGEVRTPRMPVPRMYTVQAIRGDSQIDLVFLVEIYNPNPFDLRIKAMNTKVSLNEKQVGNTENGVDTVPGGGASQYSVPLNVTQQTYGKDLIPLAKQNRIKYHMVGELDLGIIKVPVNLSGGVPFGT